LGRVMVLAWRLAFVPVSEGRDIALGEEGAAGGWCGFPGCCDIRNTRETAPVRARTGAKSAGARQGGEGAKPANQKGRRCAEQPMRRAANVRNRQQANPPGWKRPISKAARGEAGEGGPAIA